MKKLNPIYILMQHKISLKMNTDEEKRGQKNSKKNSFAAVCRMRILKKDPKILFEGILKTKEERN